MAKFFLPILLLIAASAIAQTRPDFSGEWKLNPDASQFPNPKGIPTRLVRTVELKGDNLHCVIDREVNGKSDHSDFEIQIGDSDSKAPISAKWNGSILIVSLISEQGVRQVENWELSSNGKRIVDRTVVYRPDGSEVKVLRVFDRQ